MQGHIPTLIEKKRDGERHTAEEIRFLVDGYLTGQVSEAQMSAWTMAVFFRGLDEQETVSLTLALRDSGEVFEWPEGTPPKVDKHSTGGVGDKVSLPLAPLLACEGLWVPMISGRGLGITGGTLDKLESIPGYRTQLSKSEALRQLERVGAFIAGASETFCPGDRKLYALRDVTGTVPARGLIVASILSKKLAESLDRLVLDVKFGRGAFMRSHEEALLLSKELCGVARASGVETSAVLSPMDEPLGRTVGNALEVAEAVECLMNKGPKDLRGLVLQLAEALCQKPSAELARHLESGAAWEKFVRMVEAQGGEAAVLERITTANAAPVVVAVEAPYQGVVRRFDAETAGRVTVFLGGGRNQPHDRVDHRVGLSEVVKVGEMVEARQPLCRIHAASKEAAASAAERLLQGIVIERQA